MHDPREKQVERLFRETGPAHHEAFIETDGADPEWPLWYAEYLYERISALLSQDLSKSELVHLILSAEEDRAENAPEADWPRHYARYVLRHLG
jgi:NAD(P)H-hydrate epimerase